MPALEKAGSHEIGGVLMGEHIAKEEFRIVDLMPFKNSVGSIMFFVRLGGGYC